MIRPFSLVCMVMAAGSGLYLYQAKHASQMLDREIDRTLKATDQARQRIGLLQAEYQLLNDQGRLQDLAGKYLTLQTTAPTQFTTFADLERRLPAVGSFPPPPPPEPVPLPAAALPAPAAMPDVTPAPQAARPAPVEVAKPVAVVPPKPAPAPVAAARPAPTPAPKPQALAAAAHPPAPHAPAMAATPVVASQPAQGGVVARAAPVPTQAAPAPGPVATSALGMARTMMNTRPASYQPRMSEP